MKLDHAMAAALAALVIATTAGSAFAALGVALEDTEVYAEADDESDTVDELDKGEFIEIVHCRGGEFCLIRSDDGKGYVAVPDLALVTDDEDEGDDEDEDEDEEDEDDE